MKKFSSRSAQFLLISFIAHIISSLAMIFSYYSHGKTANAELFFKIIVSIEAISLMLLGYQVRNLYYGKYPQKALIRCFSFIYILIGLSMIAWSSYPDGYISGSLFSLFTISALSMLISSFFVKPLHVVALEKPKKSLDELLANRPKNLIYILISATLFFLFCDIFFNSNISVSDSSPLIMKVFIQMRGYLIVSALLIYGLYRGSSWCKFYLYDLLFIRSIMAVGFLLFLYFKNGNTVLASYPLLILKVYLTLVYLYIVRSYLMETEMREWLRNCFLARKAKYYR